MADDSHAFVIALEEHYRDPALGAPSGSHAAPWLSTCSKRSVVQQANSETAVELAMAANNRLRDAVLAHPERFAAFPTPDPMAAAISLRRR